MDYPSTISTKMKQECNFQADFDAPIMPSCMYEQSQNSGLFSTAFQTTTGSNKLYQFHLAKENASFNGCRRKLDFNQNSQPSIYGLKPGQQITVARRNERERNRVKLINMTFATLREHLPFEPETNKNKKMSKVDTLKAAINYIKHLQELVDNHDAVSAVLSEACALDTMSFDLRSACPLESEEKSPTAEMNGVESETSFDGLSAGEEDLMDFSNWF